MMRPAPMGDDAVWLIANPQAGGGRAARLASQVARDLTARGLACRLVQPSSAQRATDVAADATAHGAAAVIACGGDGTVHRVAQGLLRHALADVASEQAVPLGILPGGSGDDIAGSLGFAALSASDAARALETAITRGRHRQVDVGVAETADGTVRAFLGVLSTGFDSAVNERANRMGRLAGQRYTAAMLRELASFRAVDYVLQVDQNEVRGRAMLVAVGNGPRYGGGMHVCPGAQHDDGELDVTWLGAVSKPRFLRAFPSVYSGRHVRFPYVQTYRGRRLRIEANGQVVYADGERVGDLPVTVTCRPSALRVLDCAPAS